MGSGGCWASIALEARPRFLGSATHAVAGYPSKGTVSLGARPACSSVGSCAPLSAWVVPDGPGLLGFQRWVRERSQDIPPLLSPLLPAGVLTDSSHTTKQ